MVAHGLYSAAGMVLLLSAEDADDPRRCSVVGNTRMALGEVVSLTDTSSRARYASRPHRETLQARLRELPWVQDAAIRFHVFRGTMLVVISERQPMGIGRLGTQLQLVDPLGVSDG